MDENLVGYLLNALEPDEQRAVEAYLNSSPEAQRRLETLRRLLAPLEADRIDEPVPTGLADRTIAVCLRESRPETLPMTSGLPSAPRTRFGQSLGHTVGWFRRGDALVAAGIILVLVGIGIPLLSNAVQRSQQLACQQNLSRLHTSLVAYSDLHGGEFPRVEAKPPHNVAGVYVPILKESGLLTPEINLACPAVHEPKSAGSHTRKDLDTLYRERPEEYRDAVRDLSCCYAYPLGYGVPDGKGGVVHHGLRRGVGNDQQPLLADRPDHVGNEVKAGNSPNHGQRGQNVLHVGGHVDFRTTRTVGVNGDDIYVNRDQKAAAGRDANDTVLGASWACPYTNE